MPRKNRTHFLDAIYHVMLRGNFRQEIFSNNADREYFFSLLEKATITFECKIHLFCLMTNHIHLVIEVKRIPLSKIMQTISSTYSRYYNKRLDRTGHLFQGRYLEKLIHNEQYLLVLCFYIHQNPIKAKMVSELNHYPWSSHQSYSGINKIPWLTTDYINDLIKKKSENERSSYQSFLKEMKNKSDNTDYYQIDKNGFLIIQDSITVRLNTTQTIHLVHMPLNKLAEIICSILGVNIEEISSGGKQFELLRARSLIAYFAHYYAHYHLNEIAFLFDCHAKSVSRTMHKALASPKIKKLIPMIEYQLTRLNFKSINQQIEVTENR